MTRRAVAAIGLAGLLLVGCTEAKPNGSDGVAHAATTTDLSSTPSSSAPVAAAAADGQQSDSEATPTPGAAAGATKAPAATRPKPDAALAPFYQQRLAWTGCGGGFSCAKASVPLDYAKAGGAKIEIAMIKVPARKSKKRIGSLFLNPGGPGGSGLSYARYADIPGSVRDRFDIVGFDPRGVGQSSRVRCATSDQLTQWLSVDPSPDTAPELRDFVAAAKAFAAGCQQRSRALLPFISTRNVARDLDIMRAAVGDARLTFLGKSYGTYLGALYADLFPGKVRALILDGAVDPTVDTQKLGRVQAQGFEVALTSFLNDCAKSKSCAFGQAPDIRGRLDAVLARIERQPLPTGSSRTVGPDEAYFGLAQALYSKAYGWPALRVALAEAESGNGSTLLALFDQYVDRDAKGDYSSLIESFTAISCLDRPSPLDLATYQADARTQAAESPHFGAAAAFAGLPCAYWPVPAVGPPAPLPAHGAAPILVIGTTRDPATPLVWAASLAKQLESGRLLTYDGDGHTVYGDGNSCVDKAGSAYLIDLKLPAAGKRCG